MCALTLSYVPAGPGWGLSSVCCGEKAWERWIWSGFCWQTNRQWHWQRPCPPASKLLICTDGTAWLTMESKLSIALLDSRLRSNSSTEAVKGVAMVHRMSGLCTGQSHNMFASSLHAFNKSRVSCNCSTPLIAQLTMTLTVLHLVAVYSSLGGVPGVPKVHFKGRQGEYYIMVSCVAASFVIVFSHHDDASDLRHTVAGDGHPWT